MKYTHTSKKGFLIGLLDMMTAGIFLLVYMSSGLQDEIDSVLGIKTQKYYIAYLLGIPTLFIYTLVWMAKISEKLKEKATELGVAGKLTSFRHMFFWNIPGAFILIGPMIATERFFDTLNRTEEKINECG